MSDTDKYLALYFDGPLQAWGFQSRLQRRTTMSYPTKSGIVGILCAAMGIKRNDRQAIASLANLKMQILVLKPAMRLTDYHTVGGGYDIVKNRDSIPRKVDGGAPDTVVTYREYLVDGKYGALVQGSDKLLERCEKGLKNPRWGIWLGRKACIPASPVCQGIFSRAEEAHAHLESISACKVVKTIVEVASFAEGDDTLHDVPLDFSKREFTVRRIASKNV